MIVIGEQPNRPALPAQIEQLFAAADVRVPSRGKISIRDVDRAFEGLDLEQRFHLKAVLHERGYI